MYCLVKFDVLKGFIFELKFINFFFEKLYLLDKLYKLVLWFVFIKVFLKIKLYN